MNPFRVMHIVDSLSQGGSESQALQLARMQKGKTEAVILAALRAEGPLLVEANAAGFCSIPEFPLTSFYDLRFLKSVLKCATLLRRERINVVQTHDFYSNVFGMIAAFIARVPIRVAAKREAVQIRTSSQKAVELACFRISDRIVVNSTATSSDLMSAGVDQTKIELINNGVEQAFLEYFAVAPSKEHKTECLAKLGLMERTNRKFVTMVANFRLPVKDYPTLLNSAASVIERMPEVTFLLAGEGHLLGEMKEVAMRLGIADSTRFLGECRQIKELLTVSDVCVLSSRSEGCSNAVLEYLAAGKPVVITDVGAARDLIVDGVSGYLVQPGDHAKMADYIVELLRDSQKADSFGRSARNRVREQFSEESRNERTMQIYRVSVRS